MATPCYILLFGDQTETKFSVKELFEYSERSERVRLFIERAQNAARHAFDTASTPDRGKYGFHSYLELEERILAETVPDVVVRTLLLCFAQVGHLIMRLERDDQVRDLWSKQRLVIVASCAGQIPAALAATTNSLDELADAAPEVVATSIRAGIDVDRRTNEYADDRSKSWATAVGVPLEHARQVVAGFNDSKDLTHAKGLYCGVTSAWATTIIGPPRQLEEFFGSKPFGEARVTALPINATFHALHAEKPDIEWIIGDTPKLNSLHLTDACFLSSESGAVFPPQTARDLLGEALLNILNRMTDNEKVFGEVRGISGDREVCIFSVVAEKVAARMIKVLGEHKAHVRSNI
ncbi:hypothetical protein LOZ12_005508 [Ophidiomyces ophidiicola]|uniref:uncharacterized protein n=1 Tax=Ophidiomyces ophidiicola TaxID=1387563 RepID=UPI0020C59F75|nr:uncharacterized protein LOZ57_005812 [Ophidiomyces ophidiicola]KAI1940877.1 hypothetical protein LOZ57_005812 [Ophidiomyces ophidiicola]KAI1944799.1 hypothetical protein LOZ62_003994 [Ophidiomyces ophidiicola]KAI1953086.1 hypothetical protein LOZ59_005261 [Ophidiomyces ophidiicola]KAI1970680.1 hypothetical protein LOZ56_003529 [Ophidiomyces ophidiicola]KAI2019440.1 hypothetical protein LOZ45_005492 [Ophidiomyces ophidiicola]